MKILYVVNSFRYPFVEGNIKQVFEIAEKFSKDHDVKILNFSNCKMSISNIDIIPFEEFSNEYFDVIHFYNPNIKILGKTFFFKAKKRIVTFGDGDVKSFISYAPSFFLKIFRFDHCHLYSKQQVKNMKKYEIIPPLKPNFKPIGKKSKNPTLLFLHATVEHKGFTDSIDAFKIVNKKYPNAKFKIISFRNCFQFEKVPKNVELINTVVDPQVELSKAWILLYPIRRNQSTFAVPLLYMEAAQCNTPFIGTSLGSLRDYFNSDFLVEPKNPKSLAKKIIDILDNYDKYLHKIKHGDHLNVKWENDDVISKLKKLYF